MKDFNEANRVQATALVHLLRLGYEFHTPIPMGATGSYDTDTNILKSVFETQFKKLNPNRQNDFAQVFADIKKELDDEDLGRQFYKRLITVSPYKLIDFENIEKNTFHSICEFTCKNGDDEFRPDITLFINGLPLVFIEVKKPNNSQGMMAEKERMEERCRKRAFRRFINITQLMLFTNNMEYDAAGGIVPIEGVFYCTGSNNQVKFNCFREEGQKKGTIAPFNKDFNYSEINHKDERRIFDALKIKPELLDSLEYKTNLDMDTPTNRVLTSMVSKERLLFLIRYGFAFIKDSRYDEEGNLVVRNEKHIMRYQQMFAALAIRNKLLQGAKSGIVWHTQGSGKTALSYHITKVLKDFYALQNKVAKFYFIVDRLDLLNQAKDEFELRGLKVQTANSREELMKQFRENKSLEGNSGEDEITVVNIQRFAEDTSKVEVDNYATNLQRIFIMDEAHRGYKPGGCFLSNLFNACKDSIKIALTGTPLIGMDASTKNVFGDYFHTYYYDKSIQDGYTLKIIREDIETSYRKKISDAFTKVEQMVEKGAVKRDDIVAHPVYVKALLKYIIHDLIDFRIREGDHSLGGMVICESSEQARKLYDNFKMVLEEYNSENSKGYNLKAGLVLSTDCDKKTIKETVDAFKKKNEIDILIVFNMLLTGFDAPRLKRLYFGRKLKDHGLLQAITRVNRPYKDLRYGYLIDFADIKENFDRTNEAYLRELNRYNANNDPALIGMDDAPDMYKQVMEDKETLIENIKNARQALYDYPTDNAEEFSKAITKIKDKSILIDLRRALTLAKETFNLVNSFGDEDLKKTFKNIEIYKLPQMLSEVNHRITLINQKENFERSHDHSAVINQVMEDLEFNFVCINKEVLEIIDDGSELKENIRKTHSGFKHNFDHDDPEYRSLSEEFYNLFEKKGIEFRTVEEYKELLEKSKELNAKLEEQNRKNEILKKKYNGDENFVRIHKRIKEENKKRKLENKDPLLSTYDEDIQKSLWEIKHGLDDAISNQQDILNQKILFEKKVNFFVTKEVYNSPYKNDIIYDSGFIVKNIVGQYMHH